MRHLIEEYGIGSQSFEAVKQVLKEQGALLQEGMILDATIMHAPSSTKNKKGEPDPVMHSVAKGDQWFFGMRCHIGVGAASGLVHSVVSTAANVHECNSAAERLHGEEKVAYGDSCHLGIEKREDFEGSSCQFRIAMRPGQRRALPDALKGWLEDLFEMAKAHLCAKVEHPFRMSKHQFGFQKTRCQSIKKNDDNLKMLFALASLYKIRK